METKIDYKSVFQLAQDKGYEMSFATSTTNDIPAKIDVSTYLWGDEEEVQNYIPEVLHSIKMKGYIELILISKWLRDEYDIYVSVSTNHVAMIDKRVWDRPSAVQGAIHFRTYDEALLAGVFEALNLIP